MMDVGGRLPKAPDAVEFFYTATVVARPGPVLFFALARLAASRFSEIISDNPSSTIAIALAERDSRGIGESINLKKKPIIFLK